jgi:hypothetical protein
VSKMPENMNNITGKMVIIKNMDDETQITTKTITCNITENTTTIPRINMARMGRSR